MPLKPFVSAPLRTLSEISVTTAKRAFEPALSICISSKKKKNDKQIIFYKPRNSISGIISVLIWSDTRIY